MTGVAVGLVGCAWALAAWDMGRRWLASRRVRDDMGARLDAVEKGVRDLQQAEGIRRSMGRG